MAEQDTGTFLEVPEDQRSNTDPDPAEVGEENQDAFTDDYGLDEGEDTPLPEDEESGDEVPRLSGEPSEPGVDHVVEPNGEPGTEVDR